MELQSGLCIWQLHAPHCKHVTCHVTSHETTGHRTLHVAVLSNVVIKCKGGERERECERERERETTAGREDWKIQTDIYVQYTYT